MNAQLPTKLVDSAALLAFCKATAESLRLDILCVLSAESFGVLELCRIFECPQSSMSHHLKILSGASLVQTRREGNSIFYRRATISSDDPIYNLTISLFESVDRMKLPACISKRRAEVHKERALQAKEFFTRHAEKLKDNQDLIAQFNQYASCVDDLLSNENIPATGTALEIGPGSSDLLATLASNFSSVIALDNNEEMLAISRLKASADKLDNIDFFLGELDDTDESLQVDLIAMNMVLHHLPSPAKIFNAAKRILKTEGRLLLIDLCPHDQDWARESCGDLWLGFEPAELDNWAADAGLIKGQSAYLGLRNGFQIQVRLYQQLPRTIDINPDSQTLTTLNDT